MNKCEHCEHCRHYAYEDFCDLLQTYKARKSDDCKFFRAKDENK